MAKVDPELELETNTLILDYCLYDATKSLLNQCRAERKGETIPTHARPDNRLQICESWRTFFHHHHGSSALPADVSFRARLLDLTTLFVLRHRHDPTTTPASSSLHSLRQEISSRARRWHQTLPSSSVNDPQFSSDLPLNDATLHRNQLAAGHAARIPSSELEDWAAHLGEGAYPTLLDLLTLFMELSAMRREMENAAWTLNENWMSLAGEWMLQAAIEQYTLCGAHGVAALNTAFAWGSNPSLLSASSTREERAIQDMFSEEGTVDLEIRGWQETRNYYRKYMIPAEGESVTAMLERVRKRWPADIFQDKVLGYLSALQGSHEQPALIQVEQGKLDGLSREETAALKRRCGLED